MKLAGIARFDCDRSTQEFTCYMAGLASPAITPAVGRPARCTVTLPGGTGSVGDVAPHRQQASSRIWRVATSPTRVVQAQITQRCTRYVAIHPIRRGAMPTDRVHRLIDNKLYRGSGGQPHLLPEFYKPRSLSSALDTTAMH